MNIITRRFLEGLTITVPVVVSAYVVILIFEKIDSILNLPIPGIGFIVTLAFITLIGFLASNFITKRFFVYFDKTVNRLPFVSLLYSSSKDLINAFVGEKKSFNKPVLVTISPHSQAKAIGFVTRESMEFLGIRDHVAVYLPQSYNFGGNVFIYPKSQVETIDADGAKIMAFLLSGGVSRGS